MTTRTQVVSKDAWLVTPIGSSGNYGNGTTDRLTIGRFTDISGSPDYKSRSVFQADLTALLLDGSSISAASLTITVAPETCAVRGAQQRLLMEEVLSDFGEKTMSTDCSFSSDSSHPDRVWPGPTASTDDSAFYSSSGKTTGNTMVINCTALLQRKLAEGATTLYFRLIAANSDGSGYDETNTARTITVYSHDNATSGNRPVLSVTLTTSGTPITTSDSGVGTETASVTKTGSGTVTVSDAGTGTDSAVVTVGSDWDTALDASGTGNGTGQVTLSTAAGVTTALLAAFAVADVDITTHFRIDTLPAGGRISFRILGRATATTRAYRCTARMTPQQAINLVVSKLVAGVETVLATFTNAATLLVDNDFQIRFVISGSAPTRLQAKLWRVGGSEPGFLIDITDTEATLTGAGAVGVGAEASATTSSLPTVIDFDDFTVVAP